MPKIRFDQSLEKFVTVVVTILGRDWLENREAAILRDASASLTLIIFRAIEDETLTKLKLSLVAIGSYVNDESPVLDADQSFDESLKDLQIYSTSKIKLEDGHFIDFLFVDRRIIGSDWLAKPQPELRGREVPIFVFASIKGGVGRSTALSVTASNLAEQGFRVLSIDLDLEAPGLGSMLLGLENRPKYGSLDYFVERDRSAFEGIDFVDMIEASQIVPSSAPVYVVPAFGTESLKAPGNVLAKISRAYIETTDQEGNILTFMDRTRILIEGLKEAKDFDVILVDARAGLHETLASSILGLKADILLFGVNEPQTFEGYTPLLSSLRQAVDSDPDFLLRLHMIQGKANGADIEDVKLYRDKAHQLFRKTLYDVPPDSAEQLEKETSRWFGVDDENGPHFPWIIFESAIYREFDPQFRDQLLHRSVFEEPYADLIRRISDILETEAENLV